MKRINLRTGRAPEEGLEPEKVAVEEKATDTVHTGTVHSVTINPDGQSLTSRIMRSHLFDRDRVRDLLIPAPDEMSYNPELMDDLIRGSSRDLIRGSSLIDAAIQRMREPSVFEQISALAARSSGTHTGRAVMRSDIGMGPLHDLRIDLGEPGSDRTVVGRIMPLENESEIRAAIDHTTQAEFWYNSYMGLLRNAMMQEGHPRYEELSTNQRRELVGHEADLRQFFGRLVLRLGNGVLQRSVFWGHNRRRIAILLIGGATGEYMVGVKLCDTSKVMIHERQPDWSMSEESWRTWALGELVGWGQSGAR